MIADAELLDGLPRIPHFDILPDKLGVVRKTEERQTEPKCAQRIQKTPSGILEAR
jgi:hypothetical protein